MENDLKRYWTISEIASELNIATSVIRFWEKDSPISNLFKIKRNRKNRRQFTSKLRAKIHYIYHLRYNREFTLNGCLKEIEKEGFQLVSLEEIQNY